MNKVLKMWYVCVYVRMRVLMYFFNTHTSTILLQEAKSCVFSGKWMKTEIMLSEINET